MKKTNKFKLKRKKTLKFKRKNRKNKSLKGGNKNKNIKLIVEAHTSAGFFSQFNKFIGYLVRYPEITKIEYNVKATAPKNHLPYISEGTEIFSKLFQPYDEGKEITNTIIGKEYIDRSITYKDANAYYNDNRIKLQPYYEAYKKYVKLLPNLQDKINNEIQKMKENYEQIVGIFVRSNGLADEQPNGKMPRREDYMNILNNIDKTKRTKYFFRIDNNDDLNYYKNILTPNYYTNIIRSENSKKNSKHININDYMSLDDLENLFIDIVLLSECNIILHCTSNMVTAALYMNMNSKSLFVQYK